MIDHYSSVQQTVLSLASGEISSAELVDQAIERIHSLDTKINAVVVRDFERARAAANIADKALRQGDRRPLLGVPVTVKESFNVAGLPTTWGVPAFRHWTPRSDSHAVRRLREAGAIILGKTNVAEGLADWQCHNDIFGRTSNPWDLARTPGGSSGGSAASLAAGYSFLELGSDVAGSIRIPANFCGVFGHRSTYGVLSAEGYGFPGTFAPSDLTAIGPLARTAADLLLAFQVLAGNALPSCQTCAPVLPGPRHLRLQDFRVLLLEEHPLVPSSAFVRQPLTRLAADLSKVGVSVATTSPLLPDLAQATRVCLRLLVPQTLSRVSDEQYQRIVERVQQLQRGDTSLAATGLRAGVGSHRDWLMASEARARLVLQWKRFFSEWDVVVCPVAPTPAFRHKLEPLEQRTLDIDGSTISYFDQIAWSSLATACGLPATSVPLPCSGSALPMGLQVIGPHREDRTTLAFAGHLEQIFGGFTPPEAYLH